MPASTVQWCSLLSVIMAILFLEIFLLMKLSRNLWPSNLNWQYTTEWQTYPRNIYDAAGVIYWRSKTKQTSRMSYRLDMKKDRLVSGFYFDDGDTNNLPEEWRAELRDSKGNMEPIENQKTSIKYRMGRIFKARYIRIVITKPRNDKFWDIRDIQILESKFFGHFWERVITK
jgi:hypothetical protein